MKIWKRKTLPHKVCAKFVVTELTLKRRVGVKHPGEEHQSKEGWLILTLSVGLKNLNEETLDIIS